eukprot:UN09785
MTCNKFFHNQDFHNHSELLSLIYERRLSASSRFALTSAFFCFSVLFVQAFLLVSWEHLECLFW